MPHVFPMHSLEKRIQVNFYHLNMEIWSKIIDDLVDIMFFKGIFFCQNAV